MAGFKQAECLIEVQQDSNCKGVRPQKWLIAAKAQHKNHTSATFMKETFNKIIKMFTSDVTFISSRSSTERTLDCRSS
jgi:hypothetical protein